MKRVILTTLLTGLLLVLAAAPASAQTQITLGGSGSCLTFSGTGGVNVTLAVVNCTGTANGEGALSAFSGTYLMNGGGTITLSPLGGSSWSVSQTSPIDFTWENGGTLLTGDLQLVQFDQFVATGGAFNLVFAVNLTVTGGSLDGNEWGACCGTLDMTILFDGAGGLISDLQYTYDDLTARISAGEVVPTPEPGTMALLGTGLVGLGGWLRRRKKA